jgi:hypothetical protein
VRTIYRCGFDTSFELPPLPTYNSATGVCENVALNVSYLLTWSGGKITAFTANVVLGDVPLPAGGGEVTVGQKFKAEFSHAYSGPANQTDNFASQTTPYTRSGRPGKYL